MATSIPESEVKRARETDIYEVWQRLDLPPVKAGQRAVSPFRDDSNPSLQVGGTKNVAHDYGTGESLDGIALAQRLKDCGFVEAVKWINGGNGHAVERTDSAARHQERKTKTVRSYPMPKAGQTWREWKQDAAGQWIEEDAGTVEEAYEYTGGDGTLLFYVFRLRTPEGKSFGQARPDDRGDVIRSLDGVRRVLYRLPQVEAAVEAGQPVYVVEGEKDAHSVERQ